ncbi:hypothetical protein SPRG_07054 [Saprolegnia parasitica CBS 223.65]|uniref:FYVE-type domain-containing protein n=1 Tax=Saprolegnia parasitica (strain CBS 223.65) TaxID=695850 RepID=A0A067CE56_SAPPC|nr:hypothetical protein SPRG_07054 [Saprolegnia parasitica CBS 223.65]KDO27465.1 hypothetical protein SPRG_07054 [Saprolegnia parasitica CBS 223.65]|eukprot:XP_012201903.1 hypothetical protein SPRG_07054 [Saprolegnia parasitica CBS 223.65]
MHDVFELAYDARVLDVRWVPNAASALCCLCYESFGLFGKRRHHCRLCGQLVCSACSPHKSFLVGSTRHASRTCTDCASLLTCLAAQGDPRVKRRMASPFQRKTRAPTSLPTRSSHEPPAAELRRVLLLNSKACATYYVVHNRWYEAWLAYADGATPTAPGPISNHALLYFYNGQLYPKQTLTYGNDYRFLHEDAWRTLWGVYGGGPSIAVRWDGDAPPPSSDWRVFFPTMGAKAMPKVVKPISLQRIRASSTTLSVSYPRGDVLAVVDHDAATLSAVDEQPCSPILLMAPRPSLPPAQERQRAAKEAVAAFAKAAGQARREAEGVTYRKSLVSLADVDMRISSSFCSPTQATLRTTIV